jgi:hypothetical protein
LREEVEHHSSLDNEERFAEDQVVLSACEDEQEVIDCLFGDDDFEKFKALPVVMNVAAPVSSQVIEEVKSSLPPAVAIEQPKKIEQPASFKINPDHPQIKVYRGYLKILMGKGDI